jgi:uncharacterized protein YbjT (DUF2867 family)
MTAIIVFGANGRTGRIIVEKLLDKGHDVSAAVRSPDAFSAFARSLKGPGRLSIAQVDVWDAGSIRAAIGEQTLAISAIGTVRKPNGLYSRGTDGIVRALEGSSVTRFLCVSSGGANPKDANLGVVFRKVIIPIFMSELYADMIRMEETVRASPLDWTLIRPAYLNDKPGRGRWRVVDGTNPKGGWQISRYDLADFVVAQVGSSLWSRKHPTITW